MARVRDVWVMPKMVKIHEVMRYDEFSPPFSGREVEGKSEVETYTVIYRQDGGQCVTLGTFTDLGEAKRGADEARRRYGEKSTVWVEDNQHRSYYILLPAFTEGVEVPESVLESTPEVPRRERIAEALMAALASNPNAQEALGKALAITAVRYADALISELDKEKE